MRVSKIKLGSDNCPITVGKDHNLSLESAQLIAKWPMLHNWLERVKNAGTTLDELIFTGCDFFGQKAGRLHLHAKYTDKNGARGQYRITVGEPAAVLLVVFRVAAKRFWQRDKEYALLVEQERLGFAETAYEPAGGIVKNPTNDMATLTQEVVREFVEEALGKRLDPKAAAVIKSSGLIERIGQKTEHLLKARHHPALSEHLDYFRAVIDVSQKQVNNLIGALHGNIAGNEQELERTKVHIIPIEQAWALSKKQGCMYTRDIIIQHRTNGALPSLPRSGIAGIIARLTA